mgnify:CR=1 FL=1
MPVPTSWHTYMEYTVLANRPVNWWLVVMAGAETSTDPWGCARNPGKILEDASAEALGAGAP